MIHLDRSHSYTVYVKFHLPAAAENPGLDLGRARLGSGFDQAWKFNQGNWRFDQRDLISWDMICNILCNQL